MLEVAFEANDGSYLCNAEPVISSTRNKCPCYVKCDFSLFSSYHFPRSHFGLKTTRKRPVKAGDKLIYETLAGLSPWNVNNEMRTSSLNIFTQVVTDECARAKEAGMFFYLATNSGNLLGGCSFQHAQKTAGPLPQLIKQELTHVR